VHVPRTFAADASSAVHFATPVAQAYLLSPAGERHPGGLAMKRVVSLLRSHVLLAGLLAALGLALVAGIALAATNPPPITGLTSSTHPSETTWYANANPAFSWNVPAATDSAAMGYSYVLDQTPGTDPDATVELQSLAFSQTMGPDLGGSSPHAAVVCDLNSAVDSYKDVVVCDKDGTSGNVSACLGNGDATFQSASNKAVGKEPYDIAAGDLNLDGNQDVVTAVPSNNGFYLLPGKGDGTFQNSSNVNTGGAPQGIVVADFDGDGNPDVAVAAYGASKVSVCRGKGTAGGFYSHVDFTVGSGCYDLVAADFDGDGKLDIATCNVTANTVSVLRNTSSPGSLSFAAEVHYTVGTAPYAIAAGDLNGDGKTDLVTGNGDGTGSGSVSVLRNTSSGAGNIGFAAKVDTSVGSAPRSLAVADLNGDGKADVALVDYGAGRVCMLRGNGDATFAAVFNVAVSGACAAALGDLDADGKLDLVAPQDTSPVHLAILRNTRATTASFSGKADGIWYFHVRMVDGAGATGATSTRAVRIDTSAPAITGLGSSTHPEESTWYANGDPTFSWDAATDSRSGLAGYSYEIDHASGTVPDTTVDTTGTSASYTGKADGVWYFHVRTVDNLGNGGATSTRIVRIDTTAPAITGLASSTHPVESNWYASTDPAFSWDAASDDGSGVAGYSYEIDHATDTVPDTAVDTSGTTASFSGKADGVWYFHVRTVDGAGNGGATSTRIVRIDTGPPEAITGLASSTHPVESSWYADSDPAFSWEAGTDDGSGVAGYSYVLDHSSGTVPDMSTETAGTTTSFAGKADGVWYFHVRAVDNAGNGGPTASRTVRINTGAPGATPDAPPWVTNNSVEAAAIGPDGTIYIGGEFTYVGPLTGYGAGLDPSCGAVDTSFPLVDGGYVHVSVADGSGGYYIGGDFTSVGGVARNRLAHILSDGSVDPAFDPDANSVVYALAVSGSTVYAGGAFTAIGGQARNHIAALDAGTGAATAWDPNANAGVRTVAVSGSTVYAGGYFTTIGGQFRNRIAALDATVNINNATGWDPNANSGVYALAVSGSTVYAGGAFTAIGGQARNHIAALDAGTGAATAWDPNANNYVYSLAVSGSSVYAGGDFTAIGGQARNHIAALDATVNTNNATGWDPNANSTVRTFAVSGSTVYAGGDFTTIGSATRNRIAAIDASGSATSWNPSAGSTVNALAVSGSTVYAGGSFTSVGGVTRRYIAALDRTTGAPTSWNPDANSAVITLAISGSTVYAGGSFTTIGGQTRYRIAGLNATTGTATSWSPNANGTVRTLAVSGSTVYAGGAFTAIGGQARNYIAALDATGAATAWDPNAGDTVNALAVSGSTVYVGGWFAEIGGHFRNRIAALDATVNINNATGWDPNANNYVYSLAVSGSTVYAGGEFSTIGGATRIGIAALSASTGLATAWDPNANHYVYSLAVSGSTVYVGGRFTSIGGQSRSRIAALDASTGSATSWDPNANNVVYAFAVSGSTVYVGGSFTAMGGQARPYLARFSGLPWGSTTLDGGATYANSTAVTIDSAVSDATEMRFRNEDGNWSSWEAYSASKSWTLSSGDGTKAVYAEYRTPPGNALAQSDTIILDTTDPETSDDALSSWQNGAVTVTLTADDGTGSGVASTEYKLDGAPDWTTYAGPLEITAEGNHTLVYRSTDNAGNVEDAHACHVRIDTRPPETGDNTGSGAWHAGPFTLHLTPSDEGSGMSGGQATTEYSTDEGVTWQTGTSRLYKVWKRAGGSGSFEVLVRSTDAAGNPETPHAVTVNVDGVAPATTDDAPAGAHNHDVTVHFSAGDSMSGVAETWYRLDGGSWTKGTQVTVTAAGNDGKHWIQYYSIDNVGNTETREHRCSVTIDNSGGGSLAPAVTPLPAPSAAAPQRAPRMVKRHPTFRHQGR